jgi:hypothetical protein
MGRYRRNPLTCDLDHFQAVETLSIRLHKALGHWAKNDAFNGDPLAILRGAFRCRLGLRSRTS